MTSFILVTSIYFMYSITVAFFLVSILSTWAGEGN